MKKELLATLLIGVSITLVGCRNEDIGSEEKVEQLAEKSIIAEQSKEDGQDELTRDNLSAKETKISTGTFYVGEDVAVGRYVCTGSGK